MDSGQNVEHGDERDVVRSDVSVPSNVAGEVPEKRLVLEYVRDSEFKGLFQIIGRVQGEPPDHIPGPFQVTEGMVVEFASLIKVSPRAVYYREVYDKTQFAGRLGDYMPGGRVGNFDPQQA